MSRTRIMLLALLGIAILATVDRARSDAAGIARAQAALAEYAIDWFTVDGGGAMFSSGGEYSLGGTIGQADAGVIAGSPFTLSGGYWAGSEARYAIALPLIQR